MNPIEYDIIAIDISKDTLESLSDKRSFTVSNKPDALSELTDHIATFKTPLAVFEATGGYERILMQQLLAKGLPFARVNPARVRHYAKSEGVKAKTDPIDARMIRNFAKEKNIRPETPPCEKRRQLAALLDRRSHLSEQLSREKNRLQNSDPLIRESIERMIAIVSNELETIEEDIRELVQSDAKMRSQCSVALSVCGVGEVTAWTLLAYLSEIETLNRNQIVALAGIAPFNDDSGKTKKKRRIQEGRAKVRRCLYMATKTAAVHNEVIRPYVQKLRDKGKPYKCAIVAGMRKMLIYIQSLFKKLNLQLAQ
ncbi:IS110 family transposase [Pelagicoccus enzymogenes]|jgi:transposase|uniref:IS110 family transposase n=1 Tax=Pelagicoccus enzymogenes TaxID=2773457 RepID=UPI0028107671|nr:IS110 family transposase [Pelagicoccus enzymogenes]MDQ8201327.1 IS110 family transposase [Pelagicoccus enzymogenes]